MTSENGFHITGGKSKIHYTKTVKFIRFRVISRIRE